MDSKEVLDSSIRSASYNILLQIAFRIITFALNTFIIHYVDVAVLGLLNVRFYLLFSTILFVSREAFRRVCQSCSKRDDWRKVINLVWLTVISTIISACVFSWIWLNVLSWPEGELAEKYRSSVLAISFSCILESFFEPVYVFSQAFMYIKLRVVIDSLGMILRVLGMVITVYLAPQYAVEAGYFGQVGVSILYLCGFWSFFYYEFWRRKKNNEPELPIQSLSGFLPKFPAGEEVLDWHLVKLVWSFFLQGLAKQVLTEGEKYIMTITSFLTMAEQGVFDIVNNIGSIAVRFLLLPIEDAASFYFTKKLQRVPLEQQDEKAVAEASNVLFLLIRFMTLFGLSAVFLGVPIAKTVLALYGGETLTSSVGPFLMQLNCGLIFLLALNGVTEGYATATVSKAELDMNSFFMVCTSGVYIVSALCFVYLYSSPGLAMANAVTLCLRIARSCYLINKQYEGTPYSPLKNSFPKKWEIFALMLSFVLCSFVSYFVSSEPFLPTWSPLVSGVLCGLGVLWVIVVNEPESLDIVLSRLSFLPMRVQSTIRALTRQHQRAD
ncbi:hypothetical protein QYM36_001429 [Artemia franciscana]|uniref:Protein RFT1 homolog n=1 Tax=Artemia franciscana TaxID=6661 RepID=A0AA88I9B1_ARTSF|nr:hypothetical protein QYM36_001429 [Artemia franciscana]